MTGCDSAKQQKAEGADDQRQQQQGCCARQDEENGQMPLGSNTNSSGQQGQQEDAPTLLDRRHFHEHFRTEAYLKDFYSHSSANEIDPAMQLVLFHLPNLVARIGPISSLLDFGSGPTVHVAVCFRHNARDIYLADYLPQNRAELARWLAGQSHFDWTPVLKIIATREALLPLGTDGLAQMERETRAKVRAILHCDCLQWPALVVPKSVRPSDAFDVITTFLTLEYCCLSLQEYAAAIQRVCAHLGPGGRLIMGGVLEETWCAFGGNRFKCLFLEREFVLRCLSNAGLQLEKDHLGMELFYERDGMFLLVAKKVTGKGESLVRRVSRRYANGERRKKARRK